MDNNIVELASSIIKKYPEISIIDSSEDNIEVSINSARFCLWLMSSSYDHNEKMPFFTAIDADRVFPHLFTMDIKIRGQNHRFICLYESDAIVKSLFSSSEKIDFIISQLLRLLNLSTSQQEKEYQKEFLAYWNRAAVEGYKAEVFISSSAEHTWLNVYYDDDNKRRRIVHSNIHLNDSKKLILNTKIKALYIPIIDTRGILPPKTVSGWTISDVLNIINNNQFQNVAAGVFNELSTYSFSGKSILIVFEMPANNTSVTFCCEVVFKNAGTMKLLQKIETNTETVKVIETIRCDYEFLNQQIGNDLSLVGKKIAIIGVGSLGSYIASETIRIGIKDIVLFDTDTMVPENLMRHRGSFFWRNINKTSVVKYELEQFHPQVNITKVDKAISADNITDLLPQDTDLVIFAVGSSDVQLECNRQLKHSCFNKPVLFCWLEGNGNSSHVLSIDYSRPGCYQCLFTDANGNWLNNKINTVTESELDNNYIRNGCGGTRVAYGNSILLQTAYMTLAAIKKVYSSNFECNFLISFTGNTITEASDWFYERSCPCCRGD